MKKSQSLFSSLLFVAVLTSSASLRAQESERPSAEGVPGAQPVEMQPTQVPPVELPSVETPEPSEMAQDVVRVPARILPAAGADRISVQLDKVGLEETINLFSQLSGVNIIIPTLASEGTVTVNLNNVEWKPALQSILEAYQLELYQKVPGVDIYTVRPQPADAPEPMDLKTFRLQYATVTDVAALIKTLLPAGGAVSEFPSRNMITVKSTPASLQEILGLIEQIDSPREQVFIEAKFLELSDRAQEDLGINWQVLEGYGVGISGIRRTFEDRTTRQTDTTKLYDMNGNQYENYTQEQVMGSETYLTETKTEYVEDPSTTTYQGFIENATGYQEYPGPGATAPYLGPAQYVADPGSTTYDRNTTTTFVEDPTTKAYRNIIDAPTVTKLGTDALAKVTTAVLTADDFRLVLSALQQNDGIDIVSNPKVIVANEETANIGIVRREPNIKQSRQQSTGDKPDIVVYELDPENPYFEYGITLAVTPTINTQNNITVDIKPELTRFVRSKVTGDGLNSYPVIDSKKVETVFALESGQTAAIGGLTEVQDSVKENKVPYLGDIPMLGRLFRYKQTVMDQKETIVFVTVGLANPVEMEIETGLPQETDLAHRYVIKGDNRRMVREAERKLFAKEQAIATDAALTDIRRKREKVEAAQQQLKEAAAELAEAVGEEEPAEPVVETPVVTESTPLEAPEEAVVTPAEAKEALLPPQVEEGTPVQEPDDGEIVE